MQKLPGWVFGVLSVVGIVLVGSMFLRWLDVGAVQVSGFRMAWHDSHWMFLVPAAGALLVGAAALRSPRTRLAALFAGLVVSGYVVLVLGHSVVSSDLATWLILGGAAAMIAGVAPGRAVLRALGGIAVLVGFFAPWSELSRWHVLTQPHLPLFIVNLQWGILLAGLAGVVSAFFRAGGKLAAIAGASIYGNILYVLYVLAAAVFGVGAWVAFGASTAALAIAVFVRQRTA